MAATEAPPAAAATRSGRSDGRRVLVVVALAVVIAALLSLGSAYLVKTHMVQAYFILSPAMEPTLEVRDRIIVNKRSDIGRGDVVVFDRPGPVRPGSGAPTELVKRIVATGGDAVESRGDVLHVNGQPVEEPYRKGPRMGGAVKAQKVPAGQVFVLGDNRANSADSRVFGPIREDAIVGRVFLVWSGGNLRRL